MTADSAWVSWQTAAAMVGCSQTTIHRHVRKGDLVRRPADRNTRSLERESVEAFARRWRAVAEERAAWVPVQHGPPDDGDVWLDARTVALMLEVSTTRVDQLARADRLPYTRHGVRRWFRRCHIEQIAAARALTRASAQSQVTSTTGPEVRLIHRQR